jgi:hypothetical protein
MPNPVWLGPAFAQIGCDHRPEMIDPAPNRLVRDQNLTLRQQIFHIAKTEREPKIQPYSLVYVLLLAYTGINKGITLLVTAMVLAQRVRARPRRASGAGSRESTLPIGPYGAYYSGYIPESISRDPRWKRSLDFSPAIPIPVASIENWQRCADGWRRIALARKLRLRAY